LHARRCTRFQTLAHLLRHHAAHTPQRTLYRFLRNDGLPDDTLTYSELDAAAAHLAQPLLGHRAQRALLLYPPGLDFIKVFFACLYAGVIPVPVYLPNTRAEHWDRLAAIARDAGATLLLLDRQHASAVHGWLAQAQPPLPLTPIVTDEAPAGGQAAPFELQPGALAFLQYTSGSTGEPKGVMVTNDNLIANQRLIQEKFGHDSGTVVVGWLPQYHDMGLIGNILQPLYLGATAVLMAPLTFLQQPVRWLEAITRYRASTSGGPDFAYRLCAERITEEQKHGLDLSSWTLAFNGAEPVSANTLDRFCAAFGHVGFHRKSFFPCYGLAEATLLATGTDKHVEPATVWLERDALANNKAVPGAACGAACQPLVSSGDVTSASSLAVVDPRTRQACADHEIGEIWLRGPSVAAGYWQRKALTEQTFGARRADGEGPYLRTGDLGFVKDGRLYITGRLKELIIIRGRNLYPQDIEQSVQQAIPGLRHGGGACFSVRPDDEERLVLVQEVERSTLRRGDFGHIWEQARQITAEQHGASLSALLLVKPGTIPKTSSGKLRRSACRDGYEHGGFECVARFEETAQQPASGPSAVGGDWAPSTPRGVQALTILAKVLGLPGPAPLSAKRSLGSYGLDSLSAAELQHRLEAEMQVALDLGELLSGMTVGRFFGLVSGQPMSAL
jgi:acyl-CoA synthetase (AMP-forming)/AMP-acid ligase II